MSFKSAIEPLLDCMCVALAEQGWEGTCCVNPGVPAFEQCCDSASGGGMAWARLVRAYPSAVFPDEDFRTVSAECVGAQQWALVVELGALRCVCDDLCDCATKDENAALVLADAEAAMQGLTCCFTSGPCRETEYRVTQLTVVGPESGCGGFRIELARAYGLTCCPSESS